MHTDESHALLLLSISREESHIALIAAGKVQKIERHPIGSESLVRSIMSFLRVDAEEARKIYERHGILRTHREPALLENLVGELSPVVQNLLTTYRGWYADEYSDQIERLPIADIVIFGEGAHMKGLLEHIRNATRVPARYVHVWRLFPQVHDVVPEIDWQDALAFAPAIAIAVEGMRK
jgi:Tfp pilus assembly PilM family ATPase